MGDLGSDSGQGTLTLTAKIVELLLALMDKIYEAWVNRGQGQLTKEQLAVAKEQLADMKSNAERKQILEDLNGKAGWVNYQDLKKSGIPLKPFTVDFTDREMQKFSEVCKRNGILFSGLTDNVEKADGTKCYDLIFKESDLERVKESVAQVSREILMENLDSKIAELEAKGDSMTEQDKVDLEYLRAQREELQRESCSDLNSRMANDVIDHAVNGGERERLTLDEALNRFTGRAIDKDVVTIVADANDPDKYIKCHGYQDTYNGKPYIKTDYEVYRGEDMVLATHDGRFDGRPENYWNDQKAEIQSAGAFSGTFFKFYTEDEYKAWAQEVKAQNEQELSSMMKGGEKDYSSIVTDLEKELDSKGGKMQDGVVVDKQTGEPITLSDGMSEEQRANVAEMTVIGKQINNYTELQDLDAELAIARTTVELAVEGSPEHADAVSALANVQERYDNAVQLESQLLDERRDINGLQGKQVVENQMAEQKYLPEDKEKIEALEAKIDAQKSEIADLRHEADYTEDSRMWQQLTSEADSKETELAQMQDELRDLKAEAIVKADYAATADTQDTDRESDEKQDDRRDERIAEKDDKQMTMEEVKGAINEHRANEGAKVLDNAAAVKQQTQDVGAKAAETVVSHATKTHDR